MKLINIGFGNLISQERLVAIVSPDSAPIKRLIQECKESVWKYKGMWEDFSSTVGFWADMDDPYVTYDNNFIESEWWALKQIWEKGLLYKGYKIVPYCPRCGTPLSSHEVAQGYKDVKERSATAKFAVKGEENTYFLAWTTTPWTLPSNTALCVGPNIDYVKVKCLNPYTEQPQTIIMASDLVPTLFGKKMEGKYTVTNEHYKGSELEGINYEQLIDWVKPMEQYGDAFRVILGDYVTISDGTGIVHIAPTFGADDDRVAKAAGIAPLFMVDTAGKTCPMVDRSGRFYRLEDLDAEFVAANVNVELYSQWAGRYVKNAYDANLTEKDETLDVSICIWLKSENKAFRIEKHVHNYPHCWRTDKPVLYYPLDSWFIRSTQAREEMMALNETINWQPESTGTGRFGKWLENLNDWNLSRSRYWGTPLPIWRTEDGQEEICIGSIAELMVEIEKSIKAGFMTENPFAKHVVGDYSKENYDPSVIDLHRPYVDYIVLCSPSGKPMKRELDLIDVWFDSGAMPYAQNHYPFENQDAPRTADFISEGVDQTRGWFFTLHAIHTMIEGSVAYKNVISNGLVLDKNGNKMSKRLGNAVDPFGALDKYANAPAMQIAHRSYVLSMLDGERLESVIREEKPDFIIPEIEAIATDRLVKLEEEGFNVIPTAAATRITMNREGIRRLAAETLGLPTSPYRFAETREEFDAAVAEIGIPCVVKPVMSSSGHGQSTIKCEADIDKAWQISQEGGRAGSGKVIVEGFVKFDYEITLLTVRHCAGTTFLKPVGHHQVDGDYRESWQPQAMSQDAIEKAEAIAKAITDALGGYGIFGVELFVKGDEVIFSEVSPRPHDTGMVTMISQDMSEFGLHARAILGLPIPDVKFYGPSASRAIVVEGETNRIEFDNLEQVLAEPGVQMRIFGKPEINGHRRMGVILATDESVEAAREKAERAYQALTVNVLPRE